MAKGKYIRTEEAKRNISLSKLGKCCNNGFKRGNIPWNKNKTNIYSEDVLLKMKMCKKGIVPWNKGKIMTEEHVEKNRLSHLGENNYWFGRKHKKSTINKMKKIWNDEKHIAYAKERRKNIVTPIKDTSIEVKIQNYLKELRMEYFTHQYINITHGYQCDIFIPSLNLVIECDGNYWHKYPTGIELDKIRTQELINKGFKVLRLWEVEINKMSLEEFKTKLKKEEDGIF